MKNIKKCGSCGKYTLKEKCLCGSPSRSAHPPKFSPGDKYVRYRKKA